MNSEKKKINRNIYILIIVAVIAAAAIVAVIGINMATGPVDQNDESKFSVVIDEGADTESIGEKLEDYELINSVFLFKVKSKLEGNDEKYRPGVYLLSKTMSMDEIMNIIVSGDTDSVRFTIPEGYTTEQTMNVLIEAGLVTEETFMEEVINGEFDYRFLENSTKDENRLEGFLYPETFEVYKNATAHDVIDKMLAHFDSLITDEYYERASELGMDIREIVTIASLIERETKVADERAKVASVIYNRLDIDMKLQIDATIQYLLDEPKEALLYSDLEIDSPYNTYLYAGLPAGPICSPRIECIDASLYPDDTNYIYYVMAPELDGHHNFSESADEFEKNKAAYKEALENQ